MRQALLPMPVGESLSDTRGRLSKSPLAAIGYKVVSAAVLACMFALIKKLGGAYPIGEVVLVRNLFAMIPILWLVHHSGGWGVLRTRRPLRHLHRSVAGLCSLFLSFTAVSMLPLGMATALGYTAPL